MSQQPSEQSERAQSLIGLDETPERESSEESSKSLLFTPPETDTGEETLAYRSGTSPPSTSPPSYFDRGQPGFREPLARGRTPLSRAPGFHIGPQPRVQRPPSTPLLEPRGPNSCRPHRQQAQRGLSHQTAQLRNDSHEADVEELVPGPATGNGGTHQNNAQGRTPALLTDRPSLSFGPPIASQQPSEFSGPIPTASDLAASPLRGQTRASRVTSSRSPESVPGRASHPSPYNQQEPDESVRQNGYHRTVVATSAATYLARREAELWNTRAHERQTDRIVHATNETPHYAIQSHAVEGDRPSTARGLYERPVHSPQTNSGISSSPSDVPSASKRPRSGNSSPTDQPATQRPRTSVTEPSRSTRLPPYGVVESALPQPHTSAAPSASFSIATISRRTIVAASSTPDPATRTSPPRRVDVNPRRPSNVTPPNPRRSTSTPRPNASGSGHRRSGLATPQRPSPSTNASLSNGRETNIRQTSTSTPPVPRSRSIAPASPAPRNTTSDRNESPSTRSLSRPNSHRNASNARRPSTPASSESQPSTTSQAHATDRGTPPVWDEGFDLWSLSTHQRTTYRHGLSPYLTTALRTERSGPQGQGGIPNADPSRFYLENNPEDPRIERIMDGLHVTRDEAIGIILGQEEVRKQQVKEKKSAAQKETAEATVAQASQDEHTTPQKRPRTEQRFRAEMARPRRRRPRTERMYREEMARLHPPSNNAQDGHRIVASQPSLVTRPTERHRPRSHTIAGPNQRDDDDDDHEKRSKTNKGKKREERHYRCHLPPDPKIPFPYPLALLTKPLNPLLSPRLDDASSAPYKLLPPHQTWRPTDLTHQNPGFRTVAQYDALCKTLHQEYKRALPSTPQLNPSGLDSDGYHASRTPAARSQRDVASTKGKHILSLLLCLLLVGGWLGSVGVARVGVAALWFVGFVLWLLLL